MRSWHDAELRTVRLASGSVRYRDIGTGRPIVFVHGALVNGSLWRGVAPRLADGFRCIVPDLPLGSHTTPMSPDADLSPKGLARTIVGLLDALDLDEATLVGNDTGGALCQIVAADFPARVSRLALTNCDCFDRFPPPEFAPLVKGARVPGFMRVLGRSLQSSAVRRSPLAYGWLTVRPIPEEVLREWTRPLGESAGVRRDLAKALRGVSPAVTLEAAEKLRRFDRPALVAWGAQDRFFPVEYARRLAATLPDARLELFEEAKAFVPEDQPERLAAAIHEFMARVARPRRPASAARFASAV